jgi:hypothetical protein
MQSSVEGLVYIAEVVGYISLNNKREEKIAIDSDTPATIGRTLDFSIKKKNCIKNTRLANSKQQQGLQRYQNATTLICATRITWTKYIYTL